MALTRSIRVGLAALMTASLLGAVPAASAKGGDGVRKSGSCSMRSDWKLKLSKDDGRIETEFEVDQNKSGQVWRVVLRHNGNVFFTGKRTTRPPSGSFEVRKFANNAAGIDHIRAKARNLKSGERCVGRASI